jgi:hypothetical protein
MTIHFSAGDEEPVDLAEVTESLFREAAEELGRCLQKIRSGKLEEVKATPALTRNVKDAFELVQEERGRFDKLRKQVAGTVGTRALDFHAARDEIGRRLACLRDAGPG